MKNWLDNKNIAVAILSGALFVGVIAAFFYGWNQYTNSSHQSEVTDAWSVILLSATVVLAVLVGLGIPYMYGKKKDGLRTTLKVLLIEAVLVAIALVVSGFFFFPTTDNCNNNTNSNYCPGGPVYQ